MDLSKNKRFSAQEAINYIPRTEKRKKVPICKMLPLGPLGLCPPITSNFVMETEDNNIQRQVHDSYTIYVGTVFSICNDFLTLYCHKELHQMMWRSEICLWFVCFLCKALPKRLKCNEADIYMFKKKSTKTRCEIFILPEEINYRYSATLT